MKSPEVMKNNGTHEYFFSKCLENDDDNLIQVADDADFVKIPIPKGELSIVTNALLMFASTTVSPRSLTLCCLGVISVAHFVMAHLVSQLQISIFLAQSFTEVFRTVVAVTLAESVPKFHRMPALVLLELVRASARTFSTLFVRLPSDTSLNMANCFEVFGFITILLAIVVYHTFQDSLYSLLARSKTNHMQDQVTHMFKKAGISLAPDAVIDQIAFENFENNDNPIEILVKTLKTFKLIQEVLVCGVISGASLAVNAFVEAETNKHGEVMFFEKSLIPVATYTISGILLLILGFLMPKKRILPVILVIPVLFVTTSALFLIPHWFHVVDECSLNIIVDKKIFPLYLAIGVFTSALTDIIRFYVKLHLLEVMPVLIRAPIISVHYFVQYSFDGNVREVCFRVIF
uniref:Solute carrier family 26 member 6 n=1 Tax=Caenorhabditis tropicalis TaxID=1561998 RepID=A0A1I7V2Y0_9PELO